MNERGPFYIGGAPKKNDNQNSTEKKILTDKKLSSESTKASGDFSEIFLIRPLPVDREYISSGRYGVIYKQLYKIMENGKEITLVKKEFHTKPTKEKIRETFEIQSNLKKAGVPVLDLYTDGKDLYSPYLNRNGITAFSGGNEIPSSVQENPEGKIKIKNFSKLLNKILDIAGKTKEAGVLLKADCLFFLADTTNLNKEEVDIDILVGDFDILSKNKEPAVAYRSLIQLRRNLKAFIEKFADKKLKEQYLAEIEKRLDPKINNDQVFTNNGVKNISDFNPQKDLILKKGEITEKCSKEQLAKIISKQLGVEYQTHEVARFANEITEETKYYVGTLKKGDEYVLNGRKNPLRIEGDVNFTNSKELKRIPENIFFEGNALFEACEALVTIPESARFQKRANFKACVNLSLESIALLKKMKESGKIKGALTLPDGEMILKTEY